MKDYKLGIILTVVIVAIVGAALFFHFRDNASGKGEKSSSDKTDSKKEKKKSKKERKEHNQDEATAVNCFAGSLVAEQTWELPKKLKEISGMAWLGQDKVGVIQDNDGIIFIYNLQSQQVEQQIKFGPKGDYEGITYANGNFFVMRSDGFMYEVNPQGKVLNEYDLPLNATDNIESFYFDAPHNRMLIGQKDGKQGSATKAVYSFDLASRKFNPKEVFTIDLNDPVINCNREGKKTNEQKEIRPSEIAIDPKSKDVVIADGPSQRVLVLSADGKAKYYLSVDKHTFPQVEGLMFSPEGQLYISTEAAKGTAKIAKVKTVLN